MGAMAVILLSTEASRRGLIEEIDMKQAAVCTDTASSECEWIRPALCATHAHVVIQARMRDRTICVRGEGINGGLCRVNLLCFSLLPTESSCAFLPRLCGFTATYSAAAPATTALLLPYHRSV